MDDLGGFGVTFVLVALFIGLIFVTVFGVILFVVVRLLLEWSRNNHAPLVTVPASVVAMRNEVTGGGDTSTFTHHYATFELRGGERLVFQLNGRDFGMLVENDRGQLSYQGTRYRAFARTPQDR
jgi:hypothetical protein